MTEEKAQQKRFLVLQDWTSLCTGLTSIPLCLALRNIKAKEPKQRPHARTQLSRSLGAGSAWAWHSGGQQRQQLCSVRAGEWPAQPGGRVERGTGEVKEHPGVWEGDRLVELLPALPDTNAAEGGSTKSRGPPTFLPLSRKRGPKRRGGMEMDPCSGGQANLPLGLPHLPSCP